MRVVPTAACDGTRFHSHLRAPAAIALVLGFNSSHVRPSFRRDPRASYVDSAQLVLRNIISLRRVNTSLPILLLVSGERDANTLKALREHWGHTDFGIRAKVLSGGDIALSDSLEVL